MQAGESSQLCQDGQDSIAGICIACDPNLAQIWQPGNDLESLLQLGPDAGAVKPLYASKICEQKACLQALLSLVA